MIDGFGGLFGGGVPSEALCGGRHESRDPECHPQILSDDLIEFEFSNGKFAVSCKLEDTGLTVSANGGNSNKRDGTRFCLKYTSADNSLLSKLNAIIKDNNLTRNNGYSCHVDGLPGGYGDRISGRYSSGEKLYMNSNQTPNVGFDATEQIYNAFHEDALKNGLDFTTTGSNVRIYDDADEEFLQGKWKGTHFGSEVLADFEGSHVKIYVDGKLTDDTDYIIFEGNVRPNKLKDGVSEAASENDYEEFEGCSCIRKKNKILLTAYFMKESYSTADLLVQREQ